MEELKEAVKFMVDKELENSNKKFDSTFHTTHEGYAIIKEEVEEAEEELEVVNAHLKDLWWNVRKNKIDCSISPVKCLKQKAVNLAAESIQVAAMCQKFIDSFEK